MIKLQMESAERKKISLDDFDIKETIGTGIFIFISNFELENLKNIF